MTHTHQEQPEARRLAETAVNAARAALHDLRQVVGALRDGSGSVVTGHCLADIDALIEESRTAGLRITYEAVAAVPVPPEVAFTAYRTVQEGLTNVAKHAPTAAAAVLVRVDASDGMLVASVRNHAPVAPRRPAKPGRPGRPLANVRRRPSLQAAEQGYGMIGLRERVELLHGTFHAGPLADGGWAVTASIPMAGRSAAPPPSAHSAHSAPTGH
ncbi:sensor histidine kinase [Streptomyces sp. NPDC002073]